MTLSAQNNPLTTGSGRVLTTCKLNDSLRDAYSCFMRCEMFFFKWPVKIRTRKSTLICFHLIVYISRFSHIYADTVRVFLITKLQRIIWRWIGATKASVSSILPTTHPNPAVCTGNRAFQKCFPIWKRHPGVLDWTAKRKMKTDLCVKLNVKASWIPRRTTWVFFKR